uniref:Uncharacterized protein n=1 Tax=Timema genevievae TaxID=629358 RepID=A0A7R9PQH4_TIMGE|nr:unnamed protein product [Timema genevievae]
MQTRPNEYDAPVHVATVMSDPSVAYLANALVVLNSTAKDGEIEVRISVGQFDERIPVGTAVSDVTPPNPPTLLRVTTQLLRI